MCMLIIVLAPPVASSHEIKVVLDVQCMKCPIGHKGRKVCPMNGPVQRLCGLCAEFKFVPWLIQCQGVKEARLYVA